MRITPILQTLIALFPSVIFSQNAAVSMHLNFDHTTAGDIQVSEVRVPAAGIWKDTYYETIGIRSNETLNAGHGYAGMQESGDSRGNRVHIFSLWDEKKENYIPHLGYGMETEIFGGEGNGSKTWCLTKDPKHPLYWQPDVWYTHVIRAWSVGTHTHYGFFVRDGVSGKWRHLSTIGMPHANIRINSGENDAFLENWTEATHDGSYRREMHLRNSLRRDLSGTWQTAQKAWFSVNDWDLAAGKRSYNFRTNWDSKIAEDGTGKYYTMISGGTQTSPTAPLSFTGKVYGTTFSIANSTKYTDYAKIAVNTLLVTKLSATSMEFAWDRDSTSLPQLNYKIEIFDNPAMTGTPVVTTSYVNTDPKTFNAPNRNKDTVDVTTLNLANQYTVRLSVTDIFDNVGTKTTAIGSGTVNDYIKLTTPNGGEIVSVGDEMIVKWATNMDSTSKISLLKDGKYHSFIGTVPNSTNSFAWKIADTISAGSNYSVRIVAQKDTTQKDVSDALFTITVPDSNFLALNRSKLSVHSFTNEQNNSTDAAKNVIDGNSETIWHTNWSGTPKHPHEIVLKATEEIAFSGITCLPRQDSENGRIKAYQIFVSTNGTSWGTAVASGTWTNNGELQTVQFTAPVKGTYLKLVSLSEQNGQSYTSIAELGVLHSTKTDGVGIGSDLPNTKALVRIESGKIQFSAHAGTYRIQLFSLNGRELIHQQVNLSEGIQAIDLAGIASQQIGILRIDGMGIKMSEKLVLP